MFDLIEKNPYYNYYLIDNQKVSTRLFALLLLGKSSEKKLIEWKLPNFEKEFDSINLLEEPSESLNFFYKKRAEDLRQQYDYLILHYSGGNDSHNILETFMFNNIFLDEILILDQFDRTFRKKLENENYQFLHLNAYDAEFSAIPLAKHFINSYSPNTKLTIIDNTFNIHANYWLNLTEKNMLENLKKTGTIGMIGKTPIRTQNLNLYNLSYKKIKENKKVAHIYGRDKVVLKLDLNGYFFIFNDISINDFMDIKNLLTCDDLPQNVEFFYTHPSNAKMIAKQAHLVMKNIPFKKLNSKIVTREYEDSIAKIIYNRKISSEYSSLKNGDILNYVFSYLNEDALKESNINLFNVSEMPLYKKLDEKITANFNKQKKIISNFLNCDMNNVEGIISQSYASRKFYIKKFR